MTLPFRRHTPSRYPFLSTSTCISMLSWKAAARSMVRQKWHLLSSSETPSLVTPLPWTSSGLPAVPAGKGALSLPLLPWTNSGLPAFLAGNVTLSLPFKRAHWTANEWEGQYFAFKKSKGIICELWFMNDFNINCSYTWSYAAYLTYMSIWSLHTVHLGIKIEPVPPRWFSFKAQLIMAGNSPSAGSDPSWCPDSFVSEFQEGGQG